ncbi:MAG: DNA recombination protein RmuC [Cellvibrionales bacterium]|nr:DNA recombination protein RmuC [Cellvibrionales bacterium]
MSLNTLDPVILSVLVALALFSLTALLLFALKTKAFNTLSIDHKESLESLQNIKLNLSLLESEKRQHQQTARELNDEINTLRTSIQTLTNEKNITDNHLASKSTLVDQLELKIHELNSTLNQERNSNTEKETKLLSQTAELTKLKTSNIEKEKHYQQSLAQFEEQKAALSEQFKLLANDILEQKSKVMQENSQHTLSHVITPFRQSIDQFKKEVTDIHHKETTQRSELKKELEQLKSLNQQITQEAHQLSTALRGQKKLQGNWGELILENVLDRSGLEIGKDYEREVSFSTDDGRKRPDAIIYLPQNKHLIIDSKVSLSAYARFVNSDDDSERNTAIKEHVSAMNDRITELASKDYANLPGINSPEIVFMFVPIESAFVEAMRADSLLFEKAIQHNVLVATPTTLLTSLNIVRKLWQYEDQNKHTAKLAELAEGVFKKLNTFLASFDSAKKSLEKATEAYQKAEGQLVGGRGNLVKQVGEFKKLAPAIQAELPAYFTEKAELEINISKDLSEKGD